MTALIYYIEYAAGLFWLAVTVISKRFATLQVFFSLQNRNQTLYITNLSEIECIIKLADITYFWKADM